MFFLAHFFKYCLFFKYIQFFIYILFFIFILFYFFLFLFIIFYFFLIQWNVLYFLKPFFYCYFIIPFLLISNTSTHDTPILQRQGIYTHNL